MRCRLCCAPLRDESFLLRHGPVDFHFCNVQHHNAWQKHRFHPDAYWILQSMPDARAKLLPAGVRAEEFLSRLGERSSDSKGQ